MNRLDDKTALVTGAGRGLGRAVAAGLARQSARVVLVARSEDELRQAANDIKREGGTAWTIQADVSQVAEVERIKSRLADIGHVDILINAAGVFGPIQPIVESDPERWLETLAINTAGPYLMCRALAGAMIERGWGRIINFSSAAAFHPPGPLNSAYGTSKVALNHFTRHLGSELAGTGVTANCIHPGEVKTQMWATIRQESQTAGEAAQGYRDWAASVGQSGGDDPQKAVDLVLELLDASAADINGQFLWIRDGLQKPLPSW